MNFILIDAPDFVLLVDSSERTAPHPLGQPQFLNPEFSDLVRLLDSHHLEGGCSGQLTFHGASILAMRRILERYGFELPPLAVSELYGLLEYCDRLDAIAGTGVFAPEQLKQWQWLADSLECGRVAPGRLAIALHTAGDTQGLRRLHREQGTLVQLGRAYRDVAESMSHLSRQF